MHLHKLTFIKYQFVLCASLQITTIFWYIKTWFWYINMRFWYESWSNEIEFKQLNVSYNTHIHLHSWFALHDFLLSKNDFHSMLHLLLYLHPQNVSVHESTIRDQAE